MPLNIGQNNSLDTYQLDDAGRSRLNALGEQFGSMFQNFVGRMPTDEETRTFIGQYVNPNRSELLNSGSARSQDPNTYLTQFISGTYQGAAKDQAMAQLEAQKGEAARLSDLFRTQGRQAINDTETQLMDYQQRLFERLRPNLITSLQAQGLLNTGGLNQAMAGAQADLATSAQGALIDQRLANEQQANAIQYGGEAAPYQYQQGNILNNLDYMRNQGQGAIDNSYRTFLTNLNFQNQMALQRDARGGGKGGFFQQLGGSMGPALGMQLGSSLGQWFSPGAGQNKAGEGGNYAAVAGLLSSKHAKKNITQLSEKEEDALYDRMINMPLSRWHYKTESDKDNRHLGVITQEAVPEIVMSDGEHLSVVDYLGALTLALKVQHRRFAKTETVRG